MGARWFVEGSRMHATVGLSNVLTDQDAEERASVAAMRVL